MDVTFQMRLISRFDQANVNTRIRPEEGAASSQFIGDRDSICPTRRMSASKASKPDAEFHGVGIIAPPANDRESEISSAPHKDAQIQEVRLKALTRRQAVRSCFAPL